MESALPCNNRRTSCLNIWWVVSISRPEKVQCEGSYAIEGSARRQRLRLFSDNNVYLLFQGLLGAYIRKGGFKVLDQCLVYTDKVQSVMEC